MNSFNNKANQFAQEVERFCALMLQTRKCKTHLIDSVKAYPKGTWVIKKNNNTYYQFVNATDDEVTLFRKGTENKVSFFDFIKEFIVANDSQVEQHEAFLRSQVIYPLTNAYKVEHKHGSVPANSLSKGFDPKNCEFYMVTCKGVHGSKVRHGSYELAIKEAKRVARKENHPAWVVGVVARVNP
jgi:hypothetical protein